MAWGRGAIFHYLFSKCVHSYINMKYKSRWINFKLTHWGLFMHSKVLQKLVEKLEDPTTQVRKALIDVAQKCSCRRENGLEEFQRLLWNAQGCCEWKKGYFNQTVWRNCQVKAISAWFPMDSVQRLVNIPQTSSDWTPLCSILNYMFGRLRHWECLSW